MAEEKKKTFVEKAQEKGITAKKLIKGSALVFGVILIFFMTFFDAIIDPSKLKLSTWLTNTLTMLAIMVFGILMGESIGQDTQQEKENGMYQIACDEYNLIREAIREIDTFFSQWWIKHKEKRLREKKIDYLVSNQFDTRVATAIVKNLDKEDIASLKYNELKPHEKIYVKELEDGTKIPFKKLNEEQIECVTKIFSITLDTFDPDYYLSLYDEEISTNDAEKGKKIAKKIGKVKLWKKVIKISSSVVISLVWGMLTIKDFIDPSGDAYAQRKAAWLNLLSRIVSLITSFASGYSTSVINVKLKARAIQNKKDILTLYDNEYKKKLFIPETYDEMIARELKEQEEYEKEHTIVGEVVDDNVENGVVLIPQKE